MVESTSSQKSDKADPQEQAGSGHGLVYGDHLDRAAFEQILEMDEGDPSQEFSRGIVFGFFEQADATLERMRESLKKRDLEELSERGHFLKGSSATLGLTKVKESCEKIQNLGKRLDETGAESKASTDVCLESIGQTLPILTDDYHEVERMLRNYYHQQESTSS